MWGEKAKRGGGGNYLYISRKSFLKRSFKTCEHVLIHVLINTVKGNSKEKVLNTFSSVVDNIYIQLLFVNLLVIKYSNP